MGELSVLKIATFPNWRLDTLTISGNVWNDFFACRDMKVFHARGRGSLFQDGKRKKHESTIEGCHQTVILPELL